MEDNIIVRVANGGDTHYAQTITDEMESSAKARGTGIAKRSPEYVARKMEEGKAVIAVLPDGTWVGFCYIEVWGHEQFVANSGLIVAPAFRKSGTAKRIKQTIFNLSRQKYPNAKIFGLTTGLAVMKINSDLGYEPVTYSELTDDEEFWAGCKSCVNYDILMSKGRKNCLCTAMLYDPADHYEPTETSEEFKQNSKLYERFMKIKQSKLLRLFRKKETGSGTGVGNKPKSIFQQFFNL
ncbi:MAG: GNAT family N-acetyltransferase [Chitinophagaceae bacterium]|nr:GNAT family N-acetyltransferase [Chitinophagaceae bacterium]MEA3424799.1 GNAT family N-acetyltransferase [Bacteroidota bacterium]MCA6452575.1 GNAT family N-acetyltransferase [Chitinophagaceae bacterium]MCA6454567.1 GNAT family N-acetyltransferase [Chitinophagaceae bacterium]MCA6458725.1 GNAT family N-acetyltransferase [Chitinophagaceae bacterium]